MFISIEEKKRIFDKIDGLTSHNERLATEILVLKAKVKVLEARPVPTVKKKYPKKPLTAAQKIKQREYMRKYNAKKKAKLALEQA
jgi:hypothetical protein